MCFINRKSIILILLQKWIFHNHGWLSKRITGAWKTDAQSALLCDSIPSTYIKHQAWWHKVIITALKRPKMWIPGVCWQPRLHGEPQVEWETLTQKPRWMSPEEWHPKLTSVLHTHMHHPNLLYPHFPLGKCHFTADPCIQTEESAKQWFYRLTLES